MKSIIDFGANIKEPGCLKQDKYTVKSQMTLKRQVRNRSSMHKI